MALPSIGVGVRRVSSYCQGAVPTAMARPGSFLAIAGRMRVRCRIAFMPHACSAAGAMTAATTGATAAGSVAAARASRRAAGSASMILLGSSRSFSATVMQSAAAAAVQGYPGVPAAAFRGPSARTGSCAAASSQVHVVCCPGLPGKGTRQGVDA